MENGKGDTLNHPTWLTAHGTTFTVGDTLMWRRHPHVCSRARVVGTCPVTGFPVVRAVGVFGGVDTATVPPHHLEPTLYP